MISQGQKEKSRQKKEYYAIYKGCRVDEPIIYSSWGDAHPRVTGCYADHGAFSTLQKARNFMNKRGVVKPKEVFKEGAGETAPLPGSQAFYAVADGKNPGIYEYYHGEFGAESKVNKFSGSCHKAFRTRAQAEAFIEDWKDTYAEIWRRAIRKALDEGLRPEDMKVQVERIFNSQESSNLSDKLNALSVKEEE